LTQLTAHEVKLADKPTHLAPQTGNLTLPARTLLIKFFEDEFDDSVGRFRTARLALRRGSRATGTGDGGRTVKKSNRANSYALQWCRSGPCESLAE
jgi:hypothetical protein